MALYLECVAVEALGPGSACAALLSGLEQLARATVLQLAQLDDNFVLRLSLVCELCAACMRAFTRDRDRLLLCRVLVYELVQALRTKTTIPDDNLFILIQFVLQGTACFPVFDVVVGHSVVSNQNSNIRIKCGENTQIDMYSEMCSKSTSTLIKEQSHIKNSVNELSNKNLTHEEKITILKILYTPREKVLLMKEQTIAVLKQSEGREGR
ncbi:unnamed protein product [Leptidea sinapis]|uniref:Uncharacterized protein n=1 Tax=Leptidea sinapis TaxID=189913 RepID=A0A5E4QQE7_9NEOP|nr:unnamed protein product [Leptidea sinapis]